MNDPNRFVTAFNLWLFDLIVTGASFFLAYRLRSMFHLPGHPLLPVTAYEWILVVILPVWAVLLPVLRAYRTPTSPLLEQIVGLSKALGCAWIVVLMFQFFSIERPSNRVLTGLTLAVDYVLLVSYRLAIFSGSNKGMKRISALFPASIVSEIPALRPLQLLATLFLLGCMLGNIEGMRRKAWEYVGQSPIGPVAAYDRRFDLVRASLGDVERVAYIDSRYPEPVGNDGGSIEGYYRSQYGMAPTILSLTMDSPYVLGNFEAGSLPQLPPNLRVVRDFGNGLVLFTYQATNP